MLFFLFSQAFGLKKSILLSFIVFTNFLGLSQGLQKIFYAQKVTKIPVQAMSYEINFLSFRDLLVSESSFLNQKSEFVPATEKSFVNEKW